MNFRVFIILLAILAIPKIGLGDTLPTTGLSYDLQEVGLFAGPTHKGVLNQLKDVTLTRTTATDMEEVFVLKAMFNSVYNGVSYGQATELVATDTSTGQVLIPKNITVTGEHKCVPAVSGNTAKFGCVYRAKDNPITDGSKIMLMIFLPDSLILFNPKFLELKDFAPPAPTCTAPSTLSDDGKTCVNPPPTPTCGENQETVNGACVCSAGFVEDTATKACVPALNENVPASPGGKDCSLGPWSSPSTTDFLFILTPVVLFSLRRFFRRA